MHSIPARSSIEEEDTDNDDDDTLFVRRHTVSSKVNRRFAEEKVDGDDDNTRRFSPKEVEEEVNWHHAKEEDEEEYRTLPATIIRAAPLLCVSTVETVFEANIVCFAEPVKFICVGKARCSSPKST